MVPELMWMPPQHSLRRTLEIADPLAAIAGARQHRLQMAPETVDPSAAMAEVIRTPWQHRCGSAIGNADV